MMRRGVVWLSYDELLRELGLPADFRLLRILDAGQQFQHIVALELEGPIFKEYRETEAPYHEPISNFRSRLKEGEAA